MRQGPRGAGGDAVPVPQAAGVVGLQGEALLARHEVLGALEEHQAPEPLEVEGRVGVPREPAGAALLGEAWQQRGALVAPASAAWKRGERGQSTKRGEGDTPGADPSVSATEGPPSPPVTRLAPPWARPRWVSPWTSMGRSSPRSMKMWLWGDMGLTGMKSLCCAAALMLEEG